MKFHPSDDHQYIYTVVYTSFDGYNATATCVKCIKTKEKLTNENWYAILDKEIGDAGSVICIFSGWQQDVRSE